MRIAMNKEKQIYDISPTISEKFAVFPGDIPFSRNISMDFGSGDNLRLSSITTTLHMGAHADAPSHYHSDGVSIDKVDPSIYLGPCQVVSTTEKNLKKRLKKEDLLLPEKEDLEPRILIKSESFPDPNKWTDDFASFCPTLIEFFDKNNVCLVGIDTPSVDPATDKRLDSHNEIYRRGMANLEGLVLSHVPDGRYTLIALPLKIANADASPIRAVLIRD